MADHLFNVCAEAAEKLVNDGHLVFQKFTCDNCRARQTISEPNKFFTTGECQECGHVTDIVKRGCNYLLIMCSTPEAKLRMLKLMEGI